RTPLARARPVPPDGLLLRGRRAHRRGPSARTQPHPGGRRRSQRPPQPLVDTALLLARRSLGDARIGRPAPRGALGRGAGARAPSAPSRDRRAAARSAVTSVTVCIPTFRRRDSLARLLESLARIQTGGAEVTVVVVDNDAEGSARTTVAAFSGSLPGLVYA